MKFLVFVCLLALFGLCLAASTTPREWVEHERGCIWIMGRCSRECEEGTHGYSTGCGYMTPEPTCDEPKPVEDTRGEICDYSACYCDEPTVRDTTTGKCVPLEECPKKE